MYVSATDVEARFLELVAAQCGYRTGQVDDYRARAAEAVAAWEAYHRWLDATVRGVVLPATAGRSAGMPAVAADALADRFIGVTRSGYDRGQVDRLRADVDYTLRDYQRRCAALRSQLRMLRAAGPTPAQPPNWTRVARLAGPALVAVAALLVGLLVVV